MRSLGSVGIVAGLMLVLAGAGWSQVPCSMPPCGPGGGGSGGGSRGTTAPPQPQFPGPGIGNDTETSPLPPQLEQDQAKMRNSERQKQLVADTQKLVTLANELKTDVDKSNKDTLSIDVIKKAEEIEKLAHSVREKMKGT